MPVVGLLNPQSPGSIPRFLDAFRRGLAESGYIEGWPFGVNAQQSLPVVGFLSSRSSEESAHLVEAFRGGLKDGGRSSAHAITRRSTQRRSTRPI
jgi:hypothetical protein